MKNPLRKLVFASLKKHPTQNIAAVLMMSLCFCFVTAATMMYDSQERLQRWEIEQRYTSAQAMLLDAEPDVWQKMQATFPLKAAGQILAAGRHDLGEDYNHLKITVGSLDASALSMSGFTLQSGTWPKAAGEIVLSHYSLMRLGQNTQIGGQITLAITSAEGAGSSAKVTKTFRLTGIFTDYTEYLKDSLGGYYYNSDMTQFSFNNLPIESCIPTALVTPEEASRIAGALDGGRTSYFLQFTGRDGELISDWDLITLNEEVIGPFFQDLLDPTRTLRYTGELAEGDLPYFVRNNSTYCWDDRLRVLGEQALRLSVGLVIGGLAVLLLGAGIASSFEIRLDSRRQQIGLLRAIGASRWQAARLMLLEALMLLLPSLLLGAGLGSLAAKLSLDRLASILGSSYILAFPSISVMLWSLGLCCFFLCLFALRPMLRLTRKSPVALLNLQGNVSAAKKIRPKKSLPHHPLRFLARRYVRLHRFRHIFPVLVLSTCLALTMTVMNLYEKNLSRYDDEAAKDEDLITMEHWKSFGASYTSDFEFELWAMNPQDLLDMSDVPDTAYEKAKALSGVIAVTAARRVSWPVLFLQPDQMTDYTRNAEWFYGEEAEYNRRIQERKKAAQYTGMPGDLHPFISQGLSLRWPEAGILGMDEESLAGLKGSLLAGAIDLDAIRKGEAVLLGASSYFKRPDPYGWDSGLTNQRKGAYVYNNDAFRVGDTVTFGKMYIYEENEKLKWRTVTQTARICGLVNANPGNVYTTADRYSAWGFLGGIDYMQIRLALGGSYDSAYRSLDMLAGQYSFDMHSRYQSQISSRRSFEGTVFLYQAILFMMGAMGLALLISNTWSRLSVREKEISLLRAVGMEGGKVLRLLFGESIRDGLWAAAIGTVLGVIACALVSNMLLYGEDMAAGRQGIAFYLSLAKDVPLSAPAIAFALYPLTGLAVSMGWIKRMTAGSIVAGIRQVE